MAKEKDAFLEEQQAELGAIDADVRPEEPDALDLVDKLFGDERLTDKGVESGIPDAGAIPVVQEPIYAQPVNKATMVCLRGPCIHYWPLIARFVSPGRDIHLKAIRQCNCHSEETGLGGQNIYHCGQWWPQWMAWVPVSARGAMRPYLIRWYRKKLEEKGYDFSWKTWSDDVFESDRPELRKKSGIEGSRITRLDKKSGKEHQS